MSIKKFLIMSLGLAQPGWQDNIGCNSTLATGTWLSLLMATRNNKHVSYNHFPISESMPLLIIISASIGGFLFAIVILVVAVTWRKVARAKSDSPNSWPKTAHQIQPDRVSNSSNDSNIQSSNTTSSMSTVDDLEGCNDLIHEFQGANQFTRSPGFDNSGKNSRNYSNQNNYSDFRQFRSEHDLLDHAAKYNSDYHNPYLQTITPTSDYNSPGSELTHCSCPLLSLL